MANARGNGRRRSLEPVYLPPLREMSYDEQLRRIHGPLPSCRRYRRVHDLPAEPWRGPKICDCCGKRVGTFLTDDVGVVVAYTPPGKSKNLQDKELHRG